MNSLRSAAATAATAAAAVVAARPKRFSHEPQYATYTVHKWTQTAVDEGCSSEYAGASPRLKMHSKRANILLISIAQSRGNILHKGFLSN